MLQERINSIREELAEVESLNELKAIWCHWMAECPEVADDAVCMGKLRAALPALRLTHKDHVKLNELMTTLAELRDRQPNKPPVQPAIKRATKRYKLLSTDVKWSTKPQVHAVMNIISAHAKPGDVLDEDYIVKMMVENEHVLETTQGGERIWKYYKGANGLQEHGNIVEVK